MIRMMISFRNDNHVLVYALQRIMDHARRTQQIFVAQCVWWLVSIIGLEAGLINYIDNQSSRIETIVTSGKLQGTAEKATTDTNELRQDQILEQLEKYPRESQRLRDIATLNSKGKTLTGRINPMPISKKPLRKKDCCERKQVIQVKKEPKKFGIDEEEIQKWKKAGEC